MMNGSPGLLPTSRTNSGNPSRLSLPYRENIATKEEKLMKGHEEMERRERSQSWLTRIGLAAITTISAVIGSQAVAG